MAVYKETKKSLSVKAYTAQVYEQEDLLAVYKETKKKPKCTGR